MRALIAALALAPLLASCAIVSVRTDGGPARIGVYPLGVRIDRGDAAAVSVSTRTVGVVAAPYMASAGVTEADVDVIDAGQCSAALVHAPIQSRAIIDRLAGATQAVCPKTQGEP